MLDLFFSLIEVQIDKGNLLATLPSWRLEFKVEFDLTITSWPTNYCQVFQFTKGGLNKSYGHCIPAMWAGFSNKTGTVYFRICSDVDGHLPIALERLLSTKCRFEQWKKIQTWSKIPFLSFNKLKAKIQNIISKSFLMANEDTMEVMTMQRTLILWNCMFLIRKQDLFNLADWKISNGPMSYN